MTKNIINFVAVMSLLSTISCKEKADDSSIVLDANNMVVAQYQSGNTVVVPKKNMKSGEYSKIEIENSDFDFGEIMQGDKVSHIFKFKNVGKGDLVILEAKASCGCTVPEWTKTPIKSGESGEVNVIFNSQGKIGQQQKTVTLTTNTEAGNEIIHFKANINPKTGENPAKTK
ncbi:hypothetical protein IA01_02695 [Flavobacterium psychrophilum]|uniref:Probable lipoprotein n=1 Tax=Flavobacterium psychrophilum (strain ATCC 49511 / DSM 21280 / CIP 103535 / JIP02/86) TaxID=402612 RepID=A6GX18_FLAPJ|nr:DUF1573 domain-containing protein [Flavobacterium psychrophilum]AIG29444.1 hypothetical protein IA03_02675 [Flavobacterium psychrophilum]AIG31721.1 hypothetical protein IA01_02695 [Flavobacterium psychrophilum]AIG33875.1 hypothetical protein IA02_02080 [Flavobacterium psychrophilum]AIG36237.1 hypothetical protein IA04_02585 [Flavobacterium psychrophilum]AIG38503.1 hypothetical protein IA05_02670 [Flavobacterium psychrophilum]